MQEKSTHTIEFEILETLVPAGTLQGVNLSGATEIKLRFRQPGNTIMEKTYTSGDVLFLTDGTDGIVRYKFTIAEALAGWWDVQAFVQWSGVSEFWTDVKEFVLKTNLPAAA